MRRAVIISAALHLLLLGFVIFGLPQFFRVKPPEQQVIAVEMVAPDQNQPAPKPQPKPEPPKAETAPPAPPPLPEPKPQRVETPPPPPPPPPVPEPKPRVVEAPPPPPPAPPQPATPAPKPPAPEVAAVTPEKMPAPAPTPKPKPTPPQPEAKPAPPAPAPKAKPQTQTQQDDLQALLKNLEKQKQQTEQTESTPQKQQAQPQQQPQAQPAPQRQQASSIDQRRAAAGLAQMVKDQVTPCWNVPAGAKDARDLQIIVAIDLNPDGTLRGSPTISDVSRYESDPFFRAAADSALRALRNPRCSPLKLPYEMYETWKHIDFTFDPKEVIG